MAGSVNKVILVGNLGKEPDIRTLSSGGRIASLSVATSESWKDKNSGERKERVEWHRVTIYNDALVSVCQNYLRKGAKVYIEGQLETRKWQDDNGIDRYSTEVTLRPFGSTLVMLDKSKNENTPPDSAYEDQQSNHEASKIDDMEDDIPF